MYFPRKILKPEVDVNTYYYYCRCCCCRWWHLLLGLLVLRPSISSLLQSVTSVITKCDSFFYYKVRQLFYYKVRQVLLQSATGITKCDNFITKCDDYYKVRQYRHMWHQQRRPLFIFFCLKAIHFKFCDNIELTIPKKRMFFAFQILAFLAWKWRHKVPAKFCF